MESHPLNLAHQQHRRAEAHLINNKYDEAMQCHHNAAELLLDAMKSTTSSVALESITLQHSYHLKQKDLIKSKKEQYLRVKKAMDNLKCLGNDQLQNLNLNESAKLEIAIYKAINENDNLLKILATKGYDKGIVKDVASKDLVDGKKIEKTQDTVLEELHILNQNLHSLVDQLVLQVEVLKDDNATLRERVNYLEKERTKYLNISVTQNDINNAQDTFDEGPKEHVQRLPITKLPNEDKPQANFDLSALKND
ncbi:nuclear receptor-binding factor 2-like [Plodia interpunctella]|uniref:nuclear receptor-binding factor 2-like n=1 Tax=Plodia interpunctella TaxID=58824 RepID=UPI002368EBD2|nr:nuclear receptor-binding factor 2-like [Plodia interpunctella]